MKKSAYEMYDVTAEKIEKSRAYARYVKDFTLGSLKKEYDLTDVEASKLAWKMVEKGLLEQTVGFQFSYIRQPNDKEEEEKETKKPEPPSLYDALFNPTPKKETTLFDDLDDDDDFDFDISRKTPRQSDLFGKTAFSPFGAGVKDFRGMARARKLRVIADFLEEPEYDEKTASYTGLLGMYYSNDKPIKLCVAYEQDGGETVCVTDRGDLLLSVQERHGLNDRIRSAIVDILDDYSMRLTDDDEILMRVYDEEGARISFMHYYAAIERISNMFRDNLVLALSEDMETRCKDIIKDIVYIRHLTLEDAIEVAEELLAEAQMDDNEEDCLIYSNVLWAFKQLTDESYEELCDDIFWDGD